MSKCENCIHYDMCLWQKGGVNLMLAENNCDFFKDKSLFVELPCKVGDTVFLCDCLCDEKGKEEFGILAGEVLNFSISNDKLWVYCRYKCGLTFFHDIDNFGNTVFLDRAEAERKLSEVGE